VSSKFWVGYARSGCGTTRRVQVGATRVSLTLLVPKPR